MINDIEKQDLKVQVSNKQIITIAIPISIAILIPQINLLINSIFLGHLSQDALGNAGITGVFYLIFSVAGHGLNSAMQTVFSSFAGSNQPNKFKSVLSQGIIISLLLSVLFILFTWLVAPMILEKVAAPSSYPEEMSFLKLRILGLPFLYLFQMGNAFLIASLNTRLLLIGFFVQATFNIGLDYILIFGNMGCPPMGFNGAAVASVLSECIGMISVYMVLVYSGLKRKYELLSDLIFDNVIFKKMGAMALPLIFQFILSVTTWLVFFLLIETRGIQAKAISNTMRNVFGIAGIFVWSFAGTCNTMIANLIGQGKTTSVIPVIKKITFWSFGLCFTIVFLLNIFPDHFFLLFNQDPQFLLEGVPVIRMVSLGILFMSISNIWLNGVTGTGKTRINLLIECIAIVLYLIYTWYFMKHHYISLAMAWSNEFIYWLTIFILSFFYLKSGKWKNQSQ